MIKIENYEVVGWEHAIRGMRNPMNSWEKSDSYFLDNDGDMYTIYGNHAPFHGDDNRNGSMSLGKNDLELMNKLAAGGPVHAKYRRMITVYVDITAPLYWWKEFDTYKVGTVANSCSTMHKIHDKEFTIEDFSCEHLMDGLSPGDERMIPWVDASGIGDGSRRYTTKGLLECLLIPLLNNCRERYLETKDKKYWWQMIQLLPSSYNQKRTVMLNYEVLTAIYKWRKNHKLNEWVEFCKWIETLPYSEVITGGVENG